MGEYAEMMLDGTCCCQCGDFLDIGGLAAGTFEEAGFPQMCAACQREDRRQSSLPRFSRYNVKDNPKIAKPGDPLRQGDKMSCPFCVRKVKVSGFGDHMLNQHRDKWGAASVDTLPKGGDGEAGSVRSKGSAVPAEERADAQNPHPGA